MATKATTKVRLLTHRSVASMLDIDPKTLRRWVASGEFPRPHSYAGRTMFYRADWVEHYLANGVWPEGVSFREAGKA